MDDAARAVMMHAAVTPRRPQTYPVPITHARMAVGRVRVAGVVSVSTGDRPFERSRICIRARVAARRGKARRGEAR